MPVYLDHNATSPPHPDVLAAALPLLTEHWGNTGSAHSLARRPFAAVEQARSQLAAWCGARPKDVVFTAGATEANNLAILGLAAPGRLFAATEHPSVAEAALRLGGHPIPVLSSGLLDLQALEALLAEHRPALVSVMAANNETGVLQPLPAIAERVHAAGALLHVDAAQAVGRIPAPEVWDLLVVTAHKSGGLKGVGALVLREGVSLEARSVGGGQERGRRSGTTNPAPIAGLGVVAGLRHGPRVRALRDRLESGCKELGGVVVGAEAPRLPNTCNVRFPGLPSDLVVMGLDLEGVCCSAGSACHSGAAQASPVLRAMGILTADALRFSLGWNTSDEDITVALAALRGVLERLRAQEALA